MTKRCRRQGFSLVEMLIGCFILAMISASFLTALRSSRKEVQFGAEHFTGMLLSAKVLEDCAQEMAVNSNGFEVLGLEGTQAPAPITEGSSVFFSDLEDSRPPWGMIQPTTDGAIDAGMPALHAQVKDFRLTAGATRLAAAGSTSPERNLCQVTVKFAWPASTGKGEFEATTLFPAPISEKFGELALDFSDADAEKELCEEIFLEPGKTLADLLALYGGDTETLMALGRLQLATRSFLESPHVVQIRRELDRVATKLKTANLTTPARNDYDLVLKAASDSYDLAREAYRFIRYVRPSVARLKGNFDQAHLGKFLIDYPSRYFNALLDYRALGRLLTASLYNAKVNYEILLEQPMMQFQDRKRHFYYLLRVISLVKTLFVIPDSPIKAVQMRSFFGHLQKFALGRYPAVYRCATQELDQVGNRSRLLEKNPVLAPIARTLEEQKAFIDDYPPRIVDQ